MKEFVLALSLSPLRSLFFSHSLSNFVRTYFLSISFVILSPSIYLSVQLCFSSSVSVLVSHLLVFVFFVSFLCLSFLFSPLQQLYSLPFSLFSSSPPPPVYPSPFPLPDSTHFFRKTADMHKLGCVGHCIGSVLFQSNGFNVIPRGICVTMHEIVQYCNVWLCAVNVILHGLTKDCMTYFTAYYKFYFV